MINKTFGQSALKSEVLLSLVQKERSSTSACNASSGDWAQLHLSPVVQESSGGWRVSCTLWRSQPGSEIQLVYRQDHECCVPAPAAWVAMQCCCWYLQCSVPFLWWTDVIRWKFTGSKAWFKKNSDSAEEEKIGLSLSLQINFQGTVHSCFLGLGSCFLSPFLGFFSGDIAASPLR